MGERGSGDGAGTAYARVPFGREMKKHFLFDPDYVNLNHGSFGTYPTPVRDELRRFQDLVESRPDPFIRYDYLGLLDASRKTLSKMLHAPLSEIVLLSNATTGINVVLRSLTFAQGDHILYFNTTYGACGKTVEYICETTPARSVQLELALPMEDEAVIEMTRKAIQEVKAQGGRVRVALLDTIISMPGARMPFERLVALCQDEGVLSLVDGAHGVGQIPLDLAKLDADFFVSNCHKWLFVPRGCAVFHVPHRNQPLIRSSLPTSHGWQPHTDNVAARPVHSLIARMPGKSDFVNEFEFIGTLDNSPYLCIPAGVAFREQACGGEDEIRKYCFKLARDGGKLVADALGSDVMRNKTDTLTECCFANVRLPLMAAPQSTTPSAGANGPSWPTVEAKHADAVSGWMQRTMCDAHNMFIAILFHNGSWWARLSSQVYLDLNDFEYGAKVLKKLCEMVGRGEFLERVEAEEKGEAKVEQDPS